MDFLDCPTMEDASPDPILTTISSVASSVPTTSFNTTSSIPTPASTETSLFNESSTAAPTMMVKIEQLGWPVKVIFHGIVRADFGNPGVVKLAQSKYVKY